MNEAIQRQDISRSTVKRRRVDSLEELVRSQNVIIQTMQMTEQRLLTEHAGSQQQRRSWLNRILRRGEEPNKQ